jgi:phosphoribosylformylglycinamidine synthase subunit PurQ / glutaminase
MQPRALIIRTAGTNCERELAHAFELAGAQSSLAHLNQLIADPGMIEAADLIGLPGGFSYGDDIAAGRIFANRLRHKLMDHFRGAVARGVPIIGICNGFQVLVKMGLLPDPQVGRQTTTLADNVTGRFIDQWLSLEVPPKTVCIWTKGLTALDLPIAHGEGRFVPADEFVLSNLRDSGQIALRYADGHNLNGSVDRIAGICDPTGLVLGLMPHPERYTHRTHHPNWAATPANSWTPPGLRFFQNAVAQVLQGATV